MGLRALYEEDTAANPKGCRVQRWVQGFADPDDQEFLYELLESLTSTDEIGRWVKKQDLTPIGAGALNDHRYRRCTCPDNTRGHRGTP